MQWKGSRWLATVMLIGAAGCGRMPTISTALPNWPVSSGSTPEEVRAQREAEIAKYIEKKPEPAATAPAPVPGPYAANSQSAPVQGTAPRRFEISPDLMQGPQSAAPRAAAPSQPPPQAAQAATRIASAAPSTAASALEVPRAARYGDLLFISGQLPVDARGNAPGPGARIEDEARMALENVRSVLESNRLSMANVVSMTVYLRDLNDIAAFDAVYASYFKGAQPARSIVEVARLRSNARIEISAVAGR
jgi:2-iminobutanoate/2-iminopropanoate deaminase